MILITIILTGITMPVATSVNLGFTDIGHHQPVTREAIYWAQANGIVTGQSGYFYPDNAVARDAFVLIM